MIHIIFRDIMILAKELGALALLYLLIRVLMRLSKTTAGRHQLPPGPKGYPVVGVLPLLFAKTNIHVALADWAKTYGATMYLKVGTEGMVVASTPDSAKAFLKTHGSNFTNRPSFTSTNIISYNLQDMAMRRDDSTWKMLRKLSNVHVLGSSALANWAHIRALEAGHMLADMCRAGERREAVVMPQVLACVVANVTGQVTLSKRIFATEGSEANEFREVVEEIIRAGALFNITDFIPSIGWLDLQGVEKVFKSLQMKFDKLISKMLEEHEASAHTRKDQPDLVDVLTANRDDPNLDERLSTTNIKATINFLLAGVDSISVTIEWALAEMIKNPTILNRALDEMDRVIGRNRRLVESDIPNLPYLQAICTETFRLHPATPINLPRVASEACTVDGYYIPKNTRLSINSWAIGRDPNTWEDPLEFKPERFMQRGEYAKIDPLGDDFRIVTFGSGRRYCAGSRMAVVLVEYVLGTLVHSFDWELASGVSEINMDEGIGLAVHKAVPIEAFVTPRLGSHCYAP